MKCLPSSSKLPVPRPTSKPSDKKCTKWFSKSDAQSVRISSGGGRGFALRSLRPHAISPRLLSPSILEGEMLYLKRASFGFSLIERGILHLKRSCLVYGLHNEEYYIWSALHDSRIEREVTGTNWPGAAGLIPRAGPILGVLNWLTKKVLSLPCKRRSLRAARIPR